MLVLVLLLGFLWDSYYLEKNNEIFSNIKQTVNRQILHKMYQRQVIRFQQRERKDGMQVMWLEHKMNKEKNTTGQLLDYINKQYIPLVISLLFMFFILLLLVIILTP